MNSSDDQTCTLALCGDVMTGRGVDQILPHPGDPWLYEGYVTDARTYVQLAEQRHCSIPHSVEWSYIWGDSLEVLEDPSVDARIINLETSITESDAYCREKGILYRMHPENIGCLSAARIDACSLANNHTLDWGRAGLLDTIDTLSCAGIAHAGAGRTILGAQAPAVLKISSQTRILLFCIAATDSGVPQDWSPSAGKAGLNVLNNFSAETAAHIGKQIAQVNGEGDLAIASIHWGDNWVHSVPAAHVEFAHRLIDAGFDLIHGHSSHHPLPFETYKRHLILYGCGDFINDYEGITGYESFRGDLAILYLPTLDCRDGTLRRLRIVPFQRGRFRLHRASPEDVVWLGNYLKETDSRFVKDLAIDGGELVMV